MRGLMIAFLRFAFFAYIANSMIVRIDAAVYGVLLLNDCKSSKTRNSDTCNQYQSYGSTHDAILVKLPSTLHPQHIMGQSGQKAILTCLASLLSNNGQRHNH